MTDKELILEAREAMTERDDTGWFWVGRLADALEASLGERDAATELAKIKPLFENLSREYPVECNKRVKAEAERDAAVAAIERVRAIVSDPCSEGCCDFCEGKNEGWEMVLQALDGAPEPEWEYGLQDADGYVSFRNLSLKSLRKRAKQTGEVIVRRRPASKWLPVEGESK